VVRRNGAQFADSTRVRSAGATDKDWELVGGSFHRWLRDNAGRVGVGSGPQNLKFINEELPFFARAYRTILDVSSTYTPGLEPVFYNAHNDSTWQPTVLLAPLVSTDGEETVRLKLAAAATCLDIWLMRRVVNYTRVGYSNVSYSMYLLPKDIRRLDLVNLIHVLKERLHADSADFSFAGSASHDRDGIDAFGINQASKRYVYHLLARITAYVESNSGRPDLFDKYVDRKSDNAQDIEHIWENDWSRFVDQFPVEADFKSVRNNIGGLLLLPADVNRSFQEKPYIEKLPYYARANLWAASLSSTAYAHQPQFKGFYSDRGLDFAPHETFTREDQEQRSKLVPQLADLIWSPDRLDSYLPQR